MKREEIRQRDLDILSFIVQDTKERGYPPSYTDIKEALGLSSLSLVAAAVKRLRESGEIVDTRGKRRSLRSADSKTTLIRHVPLVGLVAGGVPILADEVVEDVIPLPASSLGADVYLLRVRGDSMIEAGIADGDLVVVEPSSTAMDGDIVVALIGDEATVKRFFKEDGRYRLQPENASMDPLYVEELDIRGIVTNVIHSFRKGMRL